MTAVDILEDDEELEPFDNEPWAQQQDLQWEMHFVQREPPTEDEVVQINMGDETNPKPIFVSQSLSQPEQEELVVLLHEYIDVFAWSYEDMPGLDPQVAMHRLNIKPETKPVK